MHNINPIPAVLGSEIKYTKLGTCSHFPYYRPEVVESNLKTKLKHNKFDGNLLKKN